MQLCSRRLWVATRLVLSCSGEKTGGKDLASSGFRTGLPVQDQFCSSSSPRSVAYTETLPFILPSPSLFIPSFVSFLPPFFFFVLLPLFPSLAPTLFPEGLGTRLPSEAGLAVRPQNRGESSALDSDPLSSAAGELCGLGQVTLPL